MRAASELLDGQLSSGRRGLLPEGTKQLFLSVEGTGEGYREQDEGRSTAALLPSPVLRVLWFDTCLAKALGSRLNPIPGHSWESVGPLGGRA